MISIFSSIERESTQKTGRFANSKEGWCALFHCVYLNIQIIFHGWFRYWYLNSDSLKSLFIAWIITVAEELKKPFLSWISFLCITGSEWRSAFDPRSLLFSLNEVLVLCSLLPSNSSWCPLTHILQNQCPYSLFEDYYWEIRDRLTLC